MKKRITLLIVLAILTIGIVSTTSAQTFIPAPTDGSRISFTTQKPIGQSIAFKASSDIDNLWIDLNGDGKYQVGERLNHNDEKEEQTFILQSQNLTVYGDLLLFACFENELTSISLENMPNLQKLYCSENQLTCLDVSKLTKLTDLSCYQNQLKGIDLSKLISLEYLFCSKNQFTSLDVSKLRKLEYFECQENHLKSLELGKALSLRRLLCDNNQLADINLANNTTLETLYCHANRLQNLDISKLGELKSIKCYNNQIKESEMQKIVDALPNKEGPLRFRPYNPDKATNEQNQCTPEQVR